MHAERKVRVLLEMRPALDGHAGIPQETRLLFRALCALDTVEVQGLLQTSLRFLSAGMPDAREPGPVDGDESVRMHRYARLLVALEGRPPTTRFDVVDEYVRRRRVAWGLALAVLLYPPLGRIGCSWFEPKGFEQSVWQSLFAKTLAPEDFALVTTRAYRVVTIPWNTMQSAGLYARRLSGRAVYPALDTQGIDVLIAQTPYPARVSAGTALVIRYHDALPVLMPNAFANKARHLATHFHALDSNVKSGAFFACVSESTRQDLLRIFPELGDRAVTIHNIVSPHYFPEDSPSTHVPQIIRTRLNAKIPAAQPMFRSLDEQDGFYERHLGPPPMNYLLMVASIEPRKNHTLLVSAWAAIRGRTDPTLKLVIVGNANWDAAPILDCMRPWIDQGSLFLLGNVPAPELRVLYRHAAVTVCPSLAEGFDFPGIEAMRSGGVVIASDIAVHREVYADAAEYFDPLSADSLEGALDKLLFADDASNVREELRSLGQVVAVRYLPVTILPRWALFLKRVTRHG